MTQKFYYRPDLNTMELVTDPGPLRPDQPTLPGFDNLPVTKQEPKTEATKLKEAELLIDKANKKTVKELTALKHWSQPETKKELSTGGYVDKDQRMYERMNLPGYETPEKADASYKKLKEMENKEKMADKWSGPKHRGVSYDHKARTLQQEEELSKKMWLEKQKLEKQKDAYDEKKFGIKQRLKNVRGPHVAELIYQNMTPYEKGIHNAEYRLKKLDNPLFNHKIESVKIPDTTPAQPEPPLKKEKDIRVVVQEWADAKLKTKLKAHDNEYGRGGITEIVREKI